MKTITKIINLYNFDELNEKAREKVLNTEKDKLYNEHCENVDDVIALNHLYGCGVAIKGKGAEIPIRTIKNLAKNANFGGEILTVSLGCEKLVYDMLFPDLEKENLIIKIESFINYRKNEYKCCINRIK